MDYELKAKELINDFGFDNALKYAIEKMNWFKTAGNTLTAKTRLLFWENVILNISARKQSNIIPKCRNGICEIRNKCERYTSDMHYTESINSFSYSRKNKKCNHFVPNTKEIIEFIEKEFGLQS